MTAKTELTTYRRLRIALSIVLLVIAASPGVLWFFSRAEANVESDAREFNAGRRPRVVVAPGRIEPKDGVLEIAAPATSLGPAIVAQLHVRQGEWVGEGQLLATLSARDELQAAVATSGKRIEVAQAKLLAVRSSAKEDDIRALRSEVASEEANLAQVEADTRRALQLHDENILSAAAMDAQRARLAMTTRAVEAKRARLKALSSVRPADVAVAEAELQAARADAEESRAKLERTLVRAPREGRVLAIYAYPGQSVGEAGVLALGQTTEMFVDAEVMEEDLGRTLIGQPVRITGEGLAHPTSGTVEEIGYLVASRQVFVTDPTAFADARIVHVRIRASQPAALERLIHARVTVEIGP
jgi:HlyD family secretion protein